MDAGPLEAIRQIDAQLRYYMHIDPDSLDDETWAMRYNELLWIRQQEAKANKS